MKRLFILSVVLALMLGCAHTNVNPEGKLTTLPYESKYDPNIFYNYDLASGPDPLMMEDGKYAFGFILYNPEKDTDPASALIILEAVTEKLLGYGWENRDGTRFIYVLNKDETKYVRWVEDTKEDKKSEGI